MSSPSEHIKKILVENGTCSSTYGNDWFASVAGAPTDDKVVLIRDTVSDHPFYGMNDKTGSNIIYVPSIQIVVFSKNYSDGYAKTLEIRDFLRGKHRVEVDDDSSSASASATYLDFAPKGGIFFGGLDESERYIWDMNYRTFREDN